MDLATGNHLGLEGLSPVTGLKLHLLLDLHHARLLLGLLLTLLKGPNWRDRRPDLEEIAVHQDLAHHQLATTLAAL